MKEPQGNLHLAAVAGGGGWGWGRVWGGGGGGGGVEGHGSRASRSCTDLQLGHLAVNLLVKG